MPTLGGTIDIGDSGRGTTVFGFPLPVNSDTADRSTLVTSLVPDETFFPDETTAASNTLRDFTEGQDWFLKRIVGKVWVGVSQSSPVVTPAVSWISCVIGCAFFVARAKDDDPESPDLEEKEYDPLDSQNVRQPWIWRRTWLLTDFGVAPAAGLPQYRIWPSSNMLNTGGGVLDGPHLDAKTARRIRREERLWFVASTFGFNHFVDEGGTVSGSQMVCTVNVDYRILGQMRKSNNRSTF